MLAIWKPIKNYEGLYEVSNLGGVRSIKTGKVLRPRIIRGDYLQVVLYRDKRPKPFLVHRLVAAEFNENEFSKPEVNHIDGNKNNNRTDNLEWVTRCENQQHAFKTGLNNVGYGESSRHHKLTEAEVTEIRKSYIPYDKVYGASALAKIYKVSHQQISDIANNKKWKGGV